MLHALLNARTALALSLAIALTAVAARADAQRQMKALIVTAPETLREQLRHLTDRRLIEVCAALRPDPSNAGDPATAAKIALKTLARRHQTPPTLHNLWIRVWTTTSRGAPPSEHHVVPAAPPPGAAPRFGPGEDARPT